MSKLAQGNADLEASLSSAPTEVAEFAEQDGGLIRRAQHVLHQNPSLVPLIVLILSIIVFGAILGSKFFSPFALTLILQQVQIGQGIEDFRVIMDDSNNTQEDVDNNRLNGKIIVVPTRAVEFIAMDFVITNAGVEFP